MSTPEIFDALPLGKKLTIEAGLIIRHAPAGKRWIQRFRTDGKETMCTLGSYPEMSLEEAREAAAKLRNKVEPARVSKHARPRGAIAHAALSAEQLPGTRHEWQPSVRGAVSQALAPSAPTFGAIALEWLTFDDHKAPRTLKQHKHLVNLLKPIHDKPITAITLFECRDIFDALQAAGKLQTAHRAKFIASNIFGHAQRHGIDHNPCGRIKLKPFKTEHHAAIVDPQAFGKLAVDVDLCGSYDATKVLSANVGNALRFLMRTAVRQGELCGATWGEFKDLDSPTLARWEIPASRMKGRLSSAGPHVVPLSRQCVEILATQKALGLTAGLPHQFVFPAASNAAAGRHMGNSALGFAIDAMGYKGRHTPHGFRSAFSTLARESGRDDALIEMCLAHTDGNKVRGAYDRSQRLDGRRELMQWWADHVEQLQSALTV